MRRDNFAIINTYAATWIFSIFAIQFGVDNAVGVDFYRTKPHFIKTCSIAGIDFEKCSIKSMQSFLHQVVYGGVPEISEEFGSLDPLYIPAIVYDVKDHGEIKLSANYTDVIIKGLAKTRILRHSFNPQNFSTKTFALIPKVRYDGKFNRLSGQFGLSMNGSGTYFIELENVTMDISMNLSLFVKDNVIYFFNVTDLYADLDVGSCESYFKNDINTSPEDKEAEIIQNKIYKTFWRNAYKDLKDDYSKSVSKRILPVIRKSFQLIPATFFIDDLPIDQN